MVTSTDGTPSALLMCGKLLSNKDSIFISWEWEKWGACQLSQKTPWSPQSKNSPNDNQYQMQMIINIITIHPSGAGLISRHRRNIVFSPTNGGFQPLKGPEGQKSVNRQISLKLSTEGFRYSQANREYSYLSMMCSRRGWKVRKVVLLCLHWYVITKRKEVWPVS